MTAIADPAIASLGLWVAVGVLAVLLVAGGAGLFLLLAMGRLSLDLGWGRSFHPLGPITVRIEAPREMVFEIIAAPYLGRASGGSEIEVLARSDSVVVATHHSRVHFYDARTVEAIELDPPGRLGFRHLAGPVPHAVEEFRLSEGGGETVLEYTGEIGIDFFVFGRLAARHWVRPQWERVVTDHLDDVATRARDRARRSKRRAG